MLLLIKYTLLYGIVLMLVALGGMFSESTPASSTLHWKASWSLAVWRVFSP